VLKTIEQILGLESLTYFDDRVPTLLVDFRKKTVIRPRRCVLPQVSLDEVNPPDASGVKESASWDFSQPDQAPEDDLNRVIWQSVKGSGSELPPPIYNLRRATEFPFNRW
jgi:hypothetical protein